MELLKAEIVGFGKYQHKVFDFSSGLTLIFGENEGGKSTLYQFILTMLFGFPKKSRGKKDYTPKSGARFGGHLELLTSFGKVRISRFKDEKQVQIYLNGQLGNENLLKNILKPLTKENYEKVFSFQQEQLSSWDNLSEEELQKLLLSLGLLGSNDFLNVQKSLNSDQQKIFKKTGRQPLLNQKLAQVPLLEEKIAQKEAQENTYETLRENQKNLEKEIAQLKNTLFNQQEQLKAAQKKVLAAPLEKELGEIPAISLPLRKEEEKELEDLFIQYEEKERKLTFLENERQKRTGEETIFGQDFYVYLSKEEEIKTITESKPEFLAKNNHLTHLETLYQGKKEQLNLLEQQFHFDPKNPPKPFSKEQKEILKEALEKYYQEKNAQDKTQGNFSFQQKKYVPFYVGIGIISLIFTLFLPPVGKVISLLFLGGSIILGYKSLTTVEKVSQNNLANWEEEFKQIQKGYHLGNYPLKDMLEKEPLPEKYTKNLEEMRAITEEIAEIKERFFSFQQKIRQLFPDLKPGTLFDNLAEISLLNEKMGQIKFAKNQQGVVKLQEQILTLKKESQRIENKGQKLLQKAHLTFLYQVPKALKIWGEQRALLERKTFLQQQLKDFSLAEGDFPEPAFFEEKITRLEKMLQEKNEQFQEQQVTLNHLKEDGTLSVLLQEKENLLSEIKELAQKYSVLKVTENLLQDLSSEMSQQQLPHLLQKAGSYFAILTNHHFKKIILKEDRFSVQDNFGVLWEIKDLSTGTKDQLFMSFRLGFLTIGRQKVLAPVIIDDGWLYYDANRKEKLFQVLQEMSHSCQIILLSSDKWMKDQFLYHKENIQVLNTAWEEL